MSLTFNTTVTVNIDIPASGITFTPAATGTMLLGPTNAGTVLGTMSFVVTDPSYNFNNAVWSTTDSRFVLSGPGATSTLSIGAANLAGGNYTNLSIPVSVTF